MANKKIKFEFKPDKAIEVVLYIAKNTSDPTLLRTSKLLYFADKTSLEKYGRFVCGDTYVGMKHGPVPSNTYDLMKHAPDSGEIGFRIDDGRQIVACRKPKLDELSDSDVECLNAAIKIWGEAPVWKLIQDSHDKAYEQAWTNRGNKASIGISVEAIISLLDDSEQLQEHLQTQHDD